MRAPRWGLTILAALAAVVLAPAAGAQEAPAAGINVTTPFPGVAVAPGKSVSFALAITAPEGERVALEVSGVPQGWTTSLRGGGALIKEVIVTSDAPVGPTLEVSVPPEAAEGDYTMTVVADGETGTDRLELHLQVAAGVAGGVSLTAEFPALKGASEAIFSYNLDLSNDTPEEIQFALTAEGPDGWLVDAQPAAQTRASTVTLAGGDAALVTVQADPPDDTPAGVYPLRVRAAGSGEAVEVELTAEITGRYSMDLTTGDGLLNFDLEAGRSRELRLLVVNTGTGPLTGITLSAQPPSGWTVGFAPDLIALVAPGDQMAVVATVGASKDAVAGDYVLGIGVEASQASDQAELRATVETSTVWGLVGVIVIVVALGGLALVFWRFGRR